MRNRTIAVDLLDSHRRESPRRARRILSWDLRWDAFSHTTSSVFRGRNRAALSGATMAATQVEIARRVGLDVSSVNKILNRRAGPVFKKSTVERVFKVARQLGFSLERIKRTHRRAHERRQAGFSADVALYDEKDGPPID